MRTYSGSLPRFAETCIFPCKLTKYSVRLIGNLSLPSSAMTTSTMTCPVPLGLRAPAKHLLRSRYEQDKPTTPKGVVPIC